VNKKTAKEYFPLKILTKTCFIISKRLFLTLKILAFSVLFHGSDLSL